MSAVASTFLNTLLHALEEERHFALSEKQLPVPTTARSQSIQVRISIRPMHLFGHNCDTTTLRGGNGFGAGQ